MIRNLLIILVLAVPTIGGETPLPDLVFPRACIVDDVIGHECKANKDPVQCKSMSFTYKKDCIQIRVVK